MRSNLLSRAARSLVLVALVAPMNGCLLDMLMSTAIQGQLAATSAKSAMDTLRFVKDETAKIGLQQAISTYAAETGHYPESLEVLVPEWMPNVPVQPNGDPYGYNPNSGEVYSSGHAQAFTRRDDEMMQLIRQGLDAYEYDMGFPPDNLGALVPFYLIEIPFAESGKTFPYSRNLGDISHPGTPDAAPSTVSPRSMPNNLGTQSAITQQLQNMNTTSTNRANRAMREGLGTFNKLYGEGQEKMLNDLNLQ